MRLIAVSSTVTMLALALTACGGGSSDDEGQALLDTKEEVAHELAVVGSIFLSTGDDEALTAGDTESKRASRIDSRGWGRGSMARTSAVRETAGLRAKASETYNCSGGGISVATSGSMSVQYGFYGNVSAQTDYTQYTDTNCVEDYGSGQTYTYNGHSEIGDSVDAVSGYYYGYDRAGQGSTPQTLRVVGSDTDLTIRSLGLIEYKNSQDGNSNSYSQLGEQQASGRLDGDSFEYEFVYGRGNTPITYEDSSAGESLDGHYAYRSSGCEGGELSIDTLNPIFFGNTNPTPVGGKLVLSSDGDSVTVTFQSNGSATLEFGNGGSATLSQSEIANADPDNC